MLQNFSWDSWDEILKHTEYSKEDDRNYSYMFNTPITVEFEPVDFLVEVK